LQLPALLLPLALLEPAALFLHLGTCTASTVRAWLFAFSFTFLAFASEAHV
jgi:hypothetical protein